MNKKVLSLGVVLVALVGSLLAAFIPSASASRVPHASCVYTETTTCGYSTLTAGPKVAVGTALADGVIVTANNFGDLTISDHGQTVIAPKGASITIASDGSLIIATTGRGTGTGSVTLIGAKIKSIYLHPTLGITFGPNHALKTIQKYVTFTTGKTKAKLSAAKVYNRPHGQLLSTLKTPSSSLTVHIKSGIFEYTNASRAYIRKHHVKIVQLVAKFKSTTGKTYSLPMYFPITTLTPTKFLTS